MELIRTEGTIMPGDPIADELGFTKDKFSGYLFQDQEKPHVVVIPVIESLQPNKGNFRTLMSNLKKKFDIILIAYPSKDMIMITSRYGFTLRNHEMVWCIGLDELPE